MYDVQSHRPTITVVLYITQTLQNRKGMLKHYRWTNSRIAAAAR